MAPLISAALLVLSFTTAAVHGLVIAAKPVAADPAVSWPAPVFGNMTVSNIYVNVYPDTTRGYDHSIQFFWSDPSDPAGTVSTICAATWTGSSPPSSFAVCGIPLQKPFDQFLFSFPSYSSPSTFALKLQHSHQFVNSSTFKPPYDSVTVWSPNVDITLKCTSGGNIIGCYLPPITPSSNQPTPIASMLVPIVSLVN